MSVITIVALYKLVRTESLGGGIFETFIYTSFIDSAPKPGRGLRANVVRIFSLNSFPSLAPKTFDLPCQLDQQCAP